ncbi:MAG TPA: zinc ribbon domain-containing protein [Gemmatimonadetes bacterium]|jgi:putative FmdB family regulatory protein|nr:zinc ribbon domain-containing protein [Gemmatimonadota bacterium]HIL89445.1 zinc ribbon domain-containing protein [Gemmatimonadota bacterium]
MPTYDYRCPNGHQFEVFQRISAAPGAKCPDCGEDSERMISGGAGLIFKGEGFYITDYRSEDYKKKASSESGGEINKSDSDSGVEKTSSSDLNKEASKKRSKSETESSGSRSSGSKSDS